MSGRSLIGWVGGVLVAVWAAWGAKADEAVPGAASMPAAPVRTVPAPQSEQVEQIVVTAMRLRTPLRKVGSSVSVLTSQQRAMKRTRLSSNSLTCNRHNPHLPANRGKTERGRARDTWHTDF